MTVSSFKLTDNELSILRRNLNKLFVAYQMKDSFSHLDDLDKAIMHQDMQILFEIRDDIDEYFDEMERRASDQMAIEDNIELGME